MAKFRQPPYSVAEANIISKSITANGTYNASSDSADGYNPVTVNVPESVIVSKSITANGTYNASSDSADGYNPVTVSVPAYYCDYIGKYSAKATGGSNYTIFTAPTAGTYDIYVILMNGEASTYDLNISGKVNNEELVKVFNLHHDYISSGDNRRNYRICKYSVTLSQNDSVVITPSNVNNYTVLMAYITQSNISLETVANIKTVPDNVATLNDNVQGVFLYGYCVGNGGTTMGYLFNSNNHNITITSFDGTHSYGTGFIFNITI